MTLADLLAEFSGAFVEERRNDATMAGLVLAFPNGRRVILLQRTYRAGMNAILDPTEEELDVVRRGDLWELWNCEQARNVEGIA